MFAVYIVSIIFIISPFLPATGNPYWFFRTSDFIRLQSIIIQVICIALLLIFNNGFGLFHLILLIALALSLGYEITKVFKYSSLHPRKKPDFPSHGKVSILAANVLQTNTAYEKFLSVVKHHDPDLVLIMESNKAWEDALKSLEESHPHTVQIPLENFYGMHLYAKQKPKNIKVQFQIEEDVPSIFFDYKIGDQDVCFTCLHPAPPSPTENETSKERDAELMLTGKHIRELDKPVVVCGDMNDVVWSRTTRLFKKMTAMIDPRIGRGYFSTYHANYWFMRFPLDHLFHTKDLFVKVMERTEHFGSDHFGMYYEIHLKKKAQSTTTPKLHGEEKEEIENLIDRADP